MLYDERNIQSIYLGDRVTVQTIKGLKGNIIGQLPDGRAMLFDRDSPYKNMLGPNQLVDCKVIHVSPRYVIVDPISEPEPFKRVPSYSDEQKPIEEKESPDMDNNELLENLRKLSEQGEWETAIIARALSHIVNRLGTLKSIDHPPQNTVIVAEEPPIEHPSESPESDEFLEGVSSFGLIQTEVGKIKEPESELLRYIDEYQEERKNYGLLSINIENFGSVGDIPKDMRLLTMGQTRYLKQKHLKGIDGYDEIENLSNFFVEASALTRDEYGNVFYASKGTNPWNKVQRITVKRDDS